jgi:hypothetical protein
MTTNGQRLYEYKNPQYLTVVLASDVFRRNPFTVLNPVEPIPWRFLTERCKQGWEQQAQGHWLFSGEPA